MDAMTEDSPSLPTLLTDYILKGKVLTPGDVGVGILPILV